MRTTFLCLILMAAPVAVVVAPTTGCTSVKAREHVLIPALQIAASGLEVDAQRGALTLPSEQQGAAMSTIANFFNIIRSGDEDRIRMDAIVSWGRVQELIESGIVDQLAKQEVGPNGAESLRERSRKFDAALRTFITRTPVGM